VTDSDWYRHLRDLSSLGQLDEVNFWRPSAAAFHALERGEILLFKLHAPHNLIVGGGFFSHTSMLPVATAWEIFGQANGVATAGELLTRLRKLSRNPGMGLTDPITCIVLSEPFFLPPEAEIPCPPELFPRNIVTGKNFDGEAGAGLRLYARLRESLRHSRLGPGLGPATANVLEPVHRGSPHIVYPRLGQAGFRIGVTDAYRRRCAMTGERTLPALDAAHIRPVTSGGSNDVRNGLLLRRDLHSLFDLGYLGVHPQTHRILVSRRIREEFENGREYYALNGREISPPADPATAPLADGLQLHLDTVFRP
jgi:putative restriction endonuclease